MPETADAPLEEDVDRMLIALPSDMGRAEAVKQDDGRFAVWVRSQDGDYKSAWNLPTFEHAARNIMGVLWNGCLPFAAKDAGQNDLDHALEIIQLHIDDVTGDSDQESQARRAYDAVESLRGGK